MMDGFIALRASPERDPEGTAVRAILDAHLAYQRTKAARYFWVHLLAMLGAAGWICVLMPRIVPVEVRELVVALWGACGVVVLAMLAVELKWWRRQARLLARNTAIQRVSADP
jgi:hypothetical protein